MRRLRPARGLTRSRTSCGTRCAGCTPRRTHPEGENIFYYLTVYNEPYPQPAASPPFPGGKAALEQGILRGTVPVRAAEARRVGPSDHRGARGADRWPRAVAPSGRRCGAAGELLADGLGRAADVWSATSWTELRREALACEAVELAAPG